MILKKPAVCGTLESSDVRIMAEPNDGQGIEIRIESAVKAMFGEAIEESIREVLQNFEVSDAKISVFDRGALDFTIRARMECVLCRAAEVRYDWAREDQND